MISIEDQQRLLLNIAKRLKKQITVYAIGGTAMMFLGIKDATLDIDLVFTSFEDREIFKKAAKEIGYHEIDSIKIYGAKKNAPEMLQLKDERFDLFINEVIHFIFSKDMQKRAEETHQFDKNLIVRITDPHDIILMKCATDRLKDKDDARKIIESQKINWEILLKEAQNQVNLGQERAIFDLGDFLDHLKSQMQVNIPKEILDKIWALIEIQIKKRKEEIKKGG